MDMKLSKRLKRPMVNVDKEIIKKSKMQISAFVKKFGCDKFRAIESKTIAEIKNVENALIDCGGGVIEREENLINLKSNGVVFWLKASVPMIIERIKNSDEEALALSR